MWEQLLNYAVEVGLMAALFVSLLVYVLRDTKKREEKYQEMIDRLHESLGIITDIQKDVVDIKQIISREAKHEGDNKKTHRKNQKCD